MPKNLKADEPAASRPAKAALALAELKQEGGTTLERLCELTGWQAHTCRAWMTGLRKKGHDVDRTKVDGTSRYSVITGGAA